MWTTSITIHHPENEAIFRESEDDQEMGQGVEGGEEELRFEISIADGLMQCFYPQIGGLVFHF